MKFQLPSFISFIVTAIGMIERVGLVNFNVIFYLSLVLSSHPPDEPLCMQPFLYKLNIVDNLPLEGAMKKIVNQFSSDMSSFCSASSDNWTSPPPPFSLSLSR